MSKIAILMISRRRPKEVCQCVQAFHDLCGSPGNYEVHVGFDEDDISTFDAFREYVARQGIRNAQAYLSPRLGWARQYDYLNGRIPALSPDTEWVAQWTDDQHVVSKGWDTALLSMSGRFVLPWFTYTNDDEANAKFPYLTVVPWPEWHGVFATFLFPHQQTDWFVNEVCKGLVPYRRHPSLRVANLWMNDVETSDSPKVKYRNNMTPDEAQLCKSLREKLTVYVGGKQNVNADIVEQFWGITVSVGYGGCLERTLPFNAPHMEKLLVVTTPGDAKTKEVCAKYPNVEVLETEIFYEFGAVFNKGAAVEMATMMVPRSVWCLIFDADICLPPDIVMANLLDPNCLYGATRVFVYTEEQYQKAVRTRNFDIEGLDVAAGESIPGFFELFNTGANALSCRPWYGITYGNASWCDSIFECRWHLDARRKLDVRVLHLGEKENWECRVEGTFPRPSAEEGLENAEREKPRQAVSPARIVNLEVSQNVVMSRINNEVQKIRDISSGKISRDDMRALWELPEAKVDNLRGMKTLVLVLLKPNLAELLKTRCLKQLDGLSAALGAHVDIKIDEGGPGDRHISTQCVRESHLYGLRQRFVERELKPEHTHVLWIDADIAYDVDTVIRLMAYRDDVAAPLVVFNKAGTGKTAPGQERFYDIRGFVEDGREPAPLQPYFQQAGPVVLLDSVGAFYIVPADLFRAGAEFYPVAGYTEHYAVCEFARRRGRRVLCDARLKVVHPDLNQYGEKRP